MKKSKRASIPRASDYSKSFLKDWERLNRSGRYDMKMLKLVMLKLIAGEKLSKEFSDHQLIGNWKNYRECHIGGDFLLVYELVDESKHETVIFTRCGTHAEIFN